MNLVLRAPPPVQPKPVPQRMRLGWFRSQQELFDETIGRDVVRQEEGEDRKLTCC